QWRYSAPCRMSENRKLPPIFGSISTRLTSPDCPKAFRAMLIHLRTCAGSSHALKTFSAGASNRCETVTEIGCPISISSRCSLASLCYGRENVDGSRATNSKRRQADPSSASRPLDIPQPSCLRRLSRRNRPFHARDRYRGTRGGNACRLILLRGTSWSRDTPFGSQTAAQGSASLH